MRPLQRWCRAASAVSALSTVALVGACGIQDDTPAQESPTSARAWAEIRPERQIEAPTTVSDARTTNATANPTTTLRLGPPQASSNGDMSGGAHTVGPVQVQLPRGAVVDPRSAGRNPDFVDVHQRWLVPERASLIVTVQNVEPLLPDDEFLGSVTASGLSWDIYNRGPGDGSLITGVAHVNGSWVLIGSQGWTVDEREAPLQIVSEAVESVRVVE